MNQETIITFNIGAGKLIIGILVFIFGLLAIIWKSKGEISSAIKEALSPFREMGNAIVEIQTILRQKFESVAINHTLVEKGSSPLNPTEYGVSLIRDSGLEDVLNQNREILRTKLSASLPKDYTEYDVQERARQLLLALKDDPIMNQVKIWVYNNPTDIDTILRVGGLWLRDDFLGKSRGINKVGNN